MMQLVFIDTANMVEYRVEASAKCYDYDGCPEIIKFQVFRPWSEIEPYNDDFGELLNEIKKRVPSYDVYSVKMELDGVWYELM